MRLSLAFARAAVLALFLFFSIVAAHAQPTNVFTYQGRLTDTSVPANGTLNMVFDLYNVPAGGGVLDTENKSVLVTNGIFTVELDFDAVHYTGQDLYLQITVNGTPLNPRQQIRSAPYAVRSRNAATADLLSILCVACVTDAQVSNTLTSSNLVAGSSVVSNAEVDNDLTINGGVIDNTSIGGTTPSTGTFTSVRANNGSPSTPTYGFSTSPTTGIYLNGSNAMGFSGGGFPILDLSGDSGAVFNMPMQLGRFIFPPVVCSVGTSGYMYFDTDFDVIAVCDGTNWVELVTGGVVSRGASRAKQTQIERLQKQVRDQQAVIDDMRTVLCSLKPEAAICK